MNPPPTEDQSIWFRGTPHRCAKRFWRGTQRSIPPSETLAKIRPFFRQIGLTRLADITGLDWLGIPVTVAYRPNATTITTSAGKGFSTEAAMVSAAMESIEVFHAEEVTLPVFRCAYDDIPGRTIPVPRLGLTKSSLFHQECPFNWTWGWDLIGQEEVAVPSCAVGTSGSREYAKNLVSFIYGSNGLASGNNFLEAVNAAIFEVIERDAVTSNFLALNRGLVPRIVDLEKLEMPLVQDLHEKLRKAGTVLTLMDCTVDTEVPVYAALITDANVPQVGVYKGFGAHLDPEVAMIRAITEAAQSRGVYIAGSRDDCLRHHYTLNRRLSSYLADRPLEKRRHRPATIASNQSTATFEGDTTLALAKLKKVGLEQAVVIELTLPGFPIHVVKVIVPGLEGYHHDFYTPGYRAKEFLRQEGLA